jgi:hypothetical protein
MLGLSDPGSAGKLARAGDASQGIKHPSLALANGFLAGERAAAAAGSGPAINPLAAGLTAWAGPAGDWLRLFEGMRLCVDELRAVVRLVSVLTGSAPGTPAADPATTPAAPSKPVTGRKELPFYIGPTPLPDRTVPLNPVPAAAHETQRTAGGVPLGPTAPSLVRERSWDVTPLEKMGFVMGGTPSPSLDYARRCALALEKLVAMQAPPAGSQGTIGAGINLN